MQRLAPTHNQTCLIRSRPARRVDELATIVKALESKSQALDSRVASLSRHVDTLAARPTPFCTSREVDDRIELGVSVHEKLMTDLRADVDMLLAREAPAAAHPSLVGEADAARVDGRLNEWLSPLAFLSRRDRANVGAAASHLRVIAGWDDERAPQEPALASLYATGYVDEFGEWPDDDPEDMRILGWARAAGMFGR